jgi:hypothetical protein
MASHRAKNKTNALALARRLRKHGCTTSVYKKKKGYGVSATR